MLTVDIHVCARCKLADSLRDLHGDFEYPYPVCWACYANFNAKDVTNFGVMLQEDSEVPEKCPMRLEMLMTAEAE